MNSNLNTGHAINLANLSKFNLAVQSFGTDFNPANSNISAAAIAKLDTDAQQIMGALNLALVNWRNATNTRQLMFDEMNRIADRIYAMFSSLGLPKPEVEDMKQLRGKIKGTGHPRPADAGKTQNTAPANGGASGNTEIPAEGKGHTSAQLTFDEKLQNFEQIIMLAVSEPKYLPNEAELTPVSLQKKLADFKTANTAANNSILELKKARMERDTFMYDENTGALALIAQAKNYIKGLGGADNDMYKAVNKIKFRKSNS